MKSLTIINNPPPPFLEEKNKNTPLNEGITLYNRVIHRCTWGDKDSHRERKMNSAGGSNCGVYTNDDWSRVYGNPG